jgi:hypothetical protein
LTFTQFSGAGSVNAGDGLTQSGNTIHVGTANNSRIVVNSNDIDLATVTPNSSSGTAGINFVQSVVVDAYGRTTSVTTADVRAASTTQTGIVQLSDAVNSTSTTLAATANAVKTAYDLAAGALQKSGGTMTGKLNLAPSNSAGAAFNLGPGASPSLANRVVGDMWMVNNSGEIVFFASVGGSDVTRTLLHNASTISHSNISNIFVTRETPDGAVNGTNTDFVIDFIPASGTEEVFVNGVLQNSGGGNDYTITGTTITFLSGAVPQTGDVIVVSYRK